MKMCDWPSSISVRTASVDDGNTYQRFMEQSFSGDWFEQRFLWQYFGTVSKSTLLLAEVGKEPVAMVGVELRRLNNGWLCGTLIDMVVAEAWRRRGVLRALEKAASEHARWSGAAAMTSLPNTLGALALGRLPGWSIVCQVPLLSRSSNHPFPPGPVSPGITLRSTPSIEVARDAAYRAWRFAAHPRNRYVMLTTDSGKTAAVKSHGTGSSVGDIVEVYGPSTSLEAFEDIYRVAAKKLAGLGARIVITWGVLPAEECELLLGLGWETATQERYFAAKALTPPAELLYRRESWRLQPADIEHY